MKKLCKKLGPVNEYPAILTKKNFKNGVTEKKKKYKT